MKRFFLLLSFIFAYSYFLNGQTLLDESLYREGRSLIEQGKIEEALPLFKKMLNLQEKEVYTAQCYLICDINDILGNIKLLENQASGPIFLIKKDLEDKTCFRLCAGLFRNRNEAASFIKSLSSPFKEAKPYPLKLVERGTLTELAFGSVEKKEEKVKEEAEEEKDITPKIDNPLNLAEDLFLRGIEAYTKKDFKEAENLFRQSIVLNPKRYEAYNNLALVLLEERKPEEARIILEQAVSLEPNYPKARANLSGVYWLLGKKEEAIKEAERAYRLDSHDYRLSLNLASFLFEVGRFNDALTYINVAKIVAPENGDVLSLEKKIKEKLGIAEEEEKEKSGDDKQIKPESSESTTKDSEEKTKKKGILNIFKKRSK